MKNTDAPLLGLKGMSRLDFSMADRQTAKCVPAIRRYRDYHAYSISGRRYLDLWRNDGHGLLGYSIPGFQLAIKNRVSQALWGGAAHPLVSQLKKSLERCFPEHHAFLCADRETLRAVLEELDISLERPLFPLVSDLVENDKAKPLSMWLPFSGSLGPLSDAVAVLPTPGASGPIVLLASRAGSEHLRQFDALDFVSNFVPVYQVASLHLSLLALEALGAFGTDSGPRVGSRDLRQKLGMWGASAWNDVDTGRWDRSGPYLYHHFSSEAYARVCAYAIEKGIILNPRSRGLSCLPGLMSDGEQKLLESVLAFVPEGDA